MTKTTTMTKMMNNEQPKRAIAVSNKIHYTALLTHDTALRTPMGPPPIGSTGGAARPKSIYPC